MIREVIYPDPETADRFVQRNVGVELEFTPLAMAFGQQLDLDFADTRLADSDTPPQFEEHTRIDLEAYTSDQTTRVMVHRRPDGSKTILLVTPTLIDAAGQPMNPP